MRIRHSRVSALILLLPALQVLATSIVEADDKPLARAAVPAYPDVSAAPNPSLTPATGPKGTKDAPFDGQDGMPHAGPYINDDPSPTKKKPAIVEELGPKKTVIGPTEPSAEDKVLDGDKSVMQDPNRNEDKTGEKLEKVPESPKEAPQLPHSDQKQIQGEVLGSETSTRALGAVGLEVCGAVVKNKSAIANDTHRNPQVFPRAHTISHTPSPTRCLTKTLSTPLRSRRLPPRTYQMKMPVALYNHSTRSSSHSP
jgi:hypothetical protein